jgi:hypothetical protein
MSRELVPIRIAVAVIVNLIPVYVSVGGHTNEVGVMIIARTVAMETQRAPRAGLPSLMGLWEGHIAGVCTHSKCGGGSR